MGNSENIRRAVVFGATGSIGQQTVQELVDRGIPTVAVIRPSREHIPRLFRKVFPKIFVLETELTDREGIHDIVEGATEIYYTAGNFNQGRARPQIIRQFYPGIAYADADEINTYAPWRIKIEANNQNVNRFVYLSSIAAYGVQGGRLSEDSPKKARGIYGITKSRGEESLLGDKGPTAVTIFRPANVFGPGAKTWTEELYNRFANGKRFIAGTGEGMMPPVDIRDVAKAMIQSVERPEAKGEIYNLAADENLSLKEIAEYFQLITDVSPVLTPRLIAQIVGRVLDTYSNITGKSVPFSYESLSNALDPTRSIDNTKVKRDLGIEFTSVRKTMEDSLLWLNERHNLRKEESILRAFAE